jgi:uncharacterized protein (TIGR02271 family)
MPQTWIKICLGETVMALSRPRNSDSESSSPDDELKADHAWASSPINHLPGVEFSSPLENSVPLEAPRVHYLQQSVSQTAEASAAAPPPVEDMKPVLPVNSINSMASPPGELFPPIEKATSLSEEKLEGKTISLLEERLLIDRHRIKVGEVIVRKEIETRIIEVPVRCEKLIVEQISPEYKRLVEVNLGEESEIGAIEVITPSSTSAIKREFNSAKEAIQFLDTVATNAHSDLQHIKVSIVT